MFQQLWMAMKRYTDIHGSQKMKPTNSDYPLVFPLAPTSSQRYQADISYDQWKKRIVIVRYCGIHSQTMWVIIYIFKYNMFHILYNIVFLIALLLWSF